MSLAKRTALFFAFPLTVVATMGALVACSEAADEDVDDAEGAASVTPGAMPVGVPKIMGVGAQKGNMLEFQKPDKTTLFSRPFSGAWGGPMSIENNKFGPALPQVTDQGYAWETAPGKEWKCVDAEEFATGARTLTDTGQLCRVEVSTTGDGGFSVVLIGLDAAREGIKAYASPKGAQKPAKVENGKAKLIASGPPKTVNVTIDPAVTQAMLDAQNKFNSPASERNACLKNARAKDWLDIQAHYYCLLPYSPVRTCYSGKLVELVGKDPLAAPKAFAFCFAPPAAGAADSRSPEAKWIYEKQAQAFQYIMFTKQGVYDFEVGSENAAINAFYKSANIAVRPRRITDTFPAWLSSQPRYDDIRKLQFDAQEKAKASALGAADASTGG